MPGEILSELHEITTPVRFWPKFLENHTAVNLQKYFARPNQCDLRTFRKKSHKILDTGGMVLVA